MSCKTHWWQFTQKQKQEKFVLRIFIAFCFWGIKTYRKTIDKKSIGVYSTVQVIRGISLKMIKIIIIGQSKA